jgi:hypothetical protein
MCARMSDTPAHSSSAAAVGTTKKSHDLSVFVLLAYTVFMLFWFRVYFSSLPVPAVDLPGHMAGIWGIRNNLSTLGYMFYDISCFAGYTAFAFYAWVVHFFTALLSLPLTWVADDPVQLASHLVLVFAMISLPWPIAWAFKPVLTQLFDGDANLIRRSRLVVSAAGCVFSFWFINHDNQWYGMGAAAVMNIGLFSQAYGWHCLIIFFGFLLRLLHQGRQKDARRAGAAFALLFMVHTMTAIFAFYLTFMSFLWFHQRRGLLVKSMVVGFGLMAFWTLPMVAYLSKYTGLDIHRPQGDFWEFLFRYPFFTYLRSISTWLHGEASMISAVEPTLVFLLTVAAFSRFSHKATLLTAFLVFEVIGVTLLTSGFIATSVPQGFHYYRFQAYLLLFMVVLLSAVPAYIFKWAIMPGRPSWLEPAAQAALLGIFLTGHVTQALLPHNEREKVSSLANKTYLANEYKVLDHFRNSVNKGRVLFEYFSDYGRYPFLSCHWMTTRLLRETGFESVNGLFVQASLSYHFPMGAANGMKANSYNGPLMFPSVQDLDDEARMQQMKEFGITHVVSGGEEFFNHVKPYAQGEPVVIGPYRITQIQEVQERVAPLRKTLVAYADVRGSIPYKFMELYFFAKKKLTQNFEIMDAKPGQSLPPQVAYILVNGSRSKAESAGNELADAVVRSGGQRPQVITVDHVPTYLLKHFGTWYQFNPEIDDFTEAGKYLDRERLLEKFNPMPVDTAVPTPEFKWEPGNQTFHLSNLKPGQLYRVDYSYVPYFWSSNAKLWRMSADRILVWAQDEKVDVSFNRLSVMSTWVGLLVTALAAYWFWRDRRVHP